MKQAVAILLVLVLAMPAYAASGAIWTTRNECGAEQQDVNHYAVGETVFVNAAGFKPGEYPWTVTGQPGGASSDPGQVVASGTVTVGASGSFCIPLYTIPGDDRGEYKVTVGGKKDNYRVRGIAEESIDCVEALEQGLLTGSITGNTATITNNADESFTISLVSYKMFAALIDDQQYYDSETVVVDENSVISIDVPACGYQIDLVCGDPITGEAPYYGNRVIDSAFVNQGNYCIQEDGSSDPSLSAALSIAPFYPQGGDYVFVCSANFPATNYNWYYGDGQILYDSTQGNTYHSYGPGSYTVACTATDGDDWATDTLGISVS
jgi:hypothetical protein